MRLAGEVMATRGLAGAVFNAAKEVALDHFIAGKLGFMQMSEVVEASLSRLAGEIVLTNPAGSLDDVLGADHLARIRAAEAAKTIRG